MRKVVRDTTPLRTIFCWPKRGETVASFQEASARAQWKRGTTRLRVGLLCRCQHHSENRFLPFFPPDSFLPSFWRRRDRTISIRPMGSLQHRVDRHATLLRFEMSRTRSFLVFRSLLGEEFVGQSSIDIMVWSQRLWKRKWRAIVSIHVCSRV